MSNHNQFDQYKEKVKDFLDQEPQKHWVFGVCAGLSQRTGWEAWAIRLIALLCLMFATMATIMVYFVMAMLFSETRPVAQTKMLKWARKLDDVIDVLVRGIRNWMSQRGTQKTNHGL